MKIMNMFTNSSYGYARAIITLIVGVLIVLWPGTAVKTIVLIMGAFLIASGVVSLIMYWRSKNVQEQSSLLIFNGAITIILGLLLALFPDFFVGIIMFLFGAVLLIFGVMQIVSLASVRKRIKLPWTAYIVPVLVAVCGVIIFFNPFKTLSAIFIFFGIVLIIYSISEFATSFSLRKVFKDLKGAGDKRDIVESDFEEL